MYFITGVAYPRPIENQFPVRQILLMDALKPEVRCVGVPAEDTIPSLLQPSNTVHLKQRYSIAQKNVVYLI